MMIYLIRHAQAGSRDNYDRLSELGEQQAHLLGDYLAVQNVNFSAIVSGAMQRQRHTARTVSDRLVQRNLPAPQLLIDDQWNEFSLLTVYQSYVPRLLEDEAEFARDYAEMQEMLKRDPNAVRGAAGRCDAMVIRSWIEHRYDCAGETWQAFKSRILSRLQALPEAGSHEAIAIFTSATPISIMTSHALELSDKQFLKLLGVIANTSITIMRKTYDELRLFSFNSTPHLNDRNRTYR
jgi:broad specificity phosphatase PhoE